MINIFLSLALTLGFHKALIVNLNKFLRHIAKWRKIRVSEKTGKQQVSAGHKIM